MAQSGFREIGVDRAGEWVEKGHRLRHFFAHRLFQLPKCAPDGYRVARSMLGDQALDRHWQLLLYADESVVAGLPDALFFDHDVIWHQQHFGRRGQVATAAVVLDSDVMHTMTHHADLVQRIGRSREHKTQIESRLRGWPWMLLNGILAFALEHGVRIVRTPDSALSMRHTDPARTVQPYLFERIYDRPPAELPGAEHRGEWWEIDVAAATAGVVVPVAGTEPVAEDRTVCIVHDLERGLGHRDDDVELARRADETARQTLEAMLAVEARASVSVTYDVVGKILNEVRADIESGGHAVAFHSFDHSDSSRQLDRCRELDYRLKGYRLPRSEPTPEITDEQLAFHNFEWLASGRRMLGTDVPQLRNRLVRLPVTLDDFSLYTGALSYDEWEAGALEHVARGPYTAIGLHDCYAHLWLDRYAELLEKVSALARVRTLDEVSADAVMSAAV